MKYKILTSEPPRDLKQIPGDGYIVLPLSISRLAEGQSPEECLEIIKLLVPKLSENSVDWVFLYTDGLYYNDERPSFEMRRFLSQKMVQHRNSMQKLLTREKALPQAFHYIPWDYISLASDAFSRCYSTLLEEYSKNEAFRQVVTQSLGERPDIISNQRFVLEEVAVSHIIRQKMVPFPKKLVQKDNFRLIVYPGSYSLADLYQWKNKLLPQTYTAWSRLNPFYASYYDSSAKEIYKFDELNLVCEGAQVKSIL